MDRVSVYLNVECSVFKFPGRQSTITMGTTGLDSTTSRGPVCFTACLNDCVANKSSFIVFLKMMKASNLSQVREEARGTMKGDLTVTQSLRHTVFSSNHISVLVKSF